MIPFGIDPSGTTLFTFDPTTADQNGEMAVVAWIHEIGIRSAGFPEFLEAILELCEADLVMLRALREAQPKPTRAPRSKSASVKASVKAGAKNGRRAARSHFS